MRHMYVYVILLIMFSYSAFAEDNEPIGAIFDHPKNNYIIAKGQCLSDKEFPELSEILHEGENWPYGRCNNEHFKLPNLCDKENKCSYLIKVK